MDAQAVAVLDAAAGALTGSVTRTAASVIGKRAGEDLIVATTRFSYTVTALLSASLSFLVRPRGWLRKTLEVAGTPPELVDQVLDAPELARLAELSPLRLELGQNSLQLELRYGATCPLAKAIERVIAIAQRARHAGRRRTRDVA
jgi:hypothetical protein